MQQRRHRLGAAFVIALSAACSTAPPASEETAAAAAPAERKYLLETVDDAAVVQLYADGFEALSLREKTLVWHLYQAALAGRDIFIDQKHRHALEMRTLLEAVVTHPQGVDAATLAEILRYTKLFWINNGPYNNLTARKFVLRTTPEAFSAAVKSAAQAGATIPLQSPDTLDAALARLGPMFFDPAAEPIVTNKAPGPGKDILLASANNLYAGVSFAEAEAFKKAGREKYGLNSRLTKQNGRLVEEVYKVGGRYSKEISAIVSHLEAAIPVAPEPTANALRALVRWYQTGEDADRAAYDIAWVADKDSSIDVINGFIEVYLDPRGIKGGWESLVFLVNKEKTERIRKFADNAQWFEDQMPFDPKYRKANVKGIVANAIDVVIETGDSGPVTPI
ncbi:MAG TPA: hypothetical protein VIY56_02790, partial [Vicinamibacterales bacterium]